MKIVIIGFGGMGGYHSQLLRQYAQTNPQYPLELAGIYDIAPARAAEAEKQGIRA